MVDEQRLSRRLDQMYSGRQDWESLWQTAYEHMAPERAVFTQGGSDRTAGSVGEYVYDSTAIDAAERLTNLVLSGLTPPWRKWFRFKPGAMVRDEEERQRMQDSLQLVEDVVYEELRRSNLYQELQPMMLDRIVGGTGGLALNLDDDRLRFKAVPLAEVALEEDDAGEVSATARRVEMSARNILRAWPEQVPEKWKQDNQDRADERYHTVEMINARDVDGSWQYLVRLRKEKAVLETAVEDRPRLLVTRWTKLPGTPYGRGPGLRALPHVRALNKIKELSLKNAALAVSGVYTVVDDGVVNPWTLSLDPGDFIPVASNAPNEKSIAPLETSANFDVAMWSFEELRSSIQEIFLADQFGPLDKTPRSATEVSERTNILAQELGSTISRLQFELLVPLIKSVVSVLQEQDRLPQGLELDGDRVKLEFSSKLSQAQLAEEEQDLMEFTQVVAQFGQIDPRAGMTVDIQAAVRKLAALKGIDPSVLRTDDDVDRIAPGAEPLVAELRRIAVSSAYNPGRSKADMAHVDGKRATAVHILNLGGKANG